ncbi:hypothetical protein YC2023_066338 [Brassica napus]
MSRRVRRSLQNLGTWRLTATLGSPETSAGFRKELSFLFNSLPTLETAQPEHTQDVRVCPSAHPGCPWLSVCVRVCPSAHTGCPWLSISTHISTVVLGLSTLSHLVDCSGDFGPRGLSVQYTQDVRGCPPAHIGPQWQPVCVRVYPSAHRTSVGVRQHTYQHVGPWTQHACPSRGLFG